jgi:hypothetical protein
MLQYYTEAARFFSIATCNYDNAPIEGISGLAGSRGAEESLFWLEVFSNAFLA